MREVRFLFIGNQAYFAASIAFCFLYMLIFGATVNVVPWVWGPEILPLEARARGTAILVSSHWMWNFVIVMITPLLINRIGWKTYLIFMCLLADLRTVVYFCYPETSNLSLEKVDNLFLPEGHKLDSEIQERRRRISSVHVADADKAISKIVEKV